MIVVSHRINTVEQLRRVPPAFGVELDLRDGERGIIVQHDPFRPGEDFSEYMKHFHHRFLILNVKCEGIEADVRKIVRARGVTDYFFLDLSFPAAAKLARQGENRIALRVSEHEPIEGVMAMKGRARWIWLDCFTRYPFPRAPWSSISRSFDICLVAPELQGRAPLKLSQARALAARYHASAVCTKEPSLWSAA